MAAPGMLALALATLFFSSVVLARPLSAAPAITSIAPGSATAGQGFTVVITGAGFEVTSTVTLNNIALSVNSATTETITATAVAGIFNTAGAFTLSVGTSEGPAFSNFQIVAGTPLLTVSPVDPTTLDAGGSVAFTTTVADAHGNSVTTDTVQWASDAGTFSTGGSNTTLYSPPALPATYLVTASLQSTGQIVQRQVTVRAGPATQLSLQPAASPIDISAGNSVAFTATLLDAANNPTTNGTVNWAASDGSFSGAGPTTVFSPTNLAGSYWVTATLAGNGASQSRQVNVGPGAAASISIARSAASVTAGSTAWLTATVRDAFSNIIAGGIVTWSKASGPGSLAAVWTRSATLTTGAGTGTAALQAHYPGLTPAQTTLTVNAGNPAQLSFAPLNASLTAGSTLAFTAWVSDSFGNATSAGSVQWSVLNGPGAWLNPLARTATFTSAVASPSVVRARISGASDVTTTVSASPAGVARITLAPPSATLPVNAAHAFVAAAFDTFNNAIPNAAFAWSSADATKATVTGSGSTATLTAKTTAGVFANLLRVSSAGITRTASITITPGAPSSIVLSPAAASIVVSTTQPFDANVFDAFGNPVPNTTLAWSVSGAQAGQIAAVDGDSALFTGSTIAGVYPAAVRVSTGSITQNAAITLNPAALNAITLNPNGITIKPAGNIAIVATGRDRFGNPISGLSFNWSVAGAAGSINPSTPGAASAVFNAGITAGSYSNAITASASQSGNTLAGSASVLITTDEVARIEVSPTSATLQPAGQEIFFARGYDKFNNLIWPLEVSWGVSGTGLITKTGSVTATFEAGTVAGGFPNAVIASTQGFSGDADVTVTAGPLAVINLTPGIVLIGIGSQQPFEAVGRDAWGNTVPNFSATWSVSPPSAGSFDATGATSALFRASVTPGTYNNVVRASSGTVNAASTVVVQPGSVASVSLSPAAATLPIQGIQVFTAVVRDQAGNPLSGLGVVWQVAPSAGVIDSSGLLTVAVKAGTRAGSFAGTVRASNGVFSAAADLVLQPDVASTLLISATPAAVQTDGVNGSVIEVLLTDQFGNPTGAGTPVQWEILACSGSCTLSNPSSLTDANGRAATTLRSDFRAPQGTTSTITVRAIAGGASKDVTVAGQFKPSVTHLPLMMRTAPINNHTSCTALVIAPPQTVQQPANAAFNIYRFRATSASYRVTIRNYATSGRMLMYRIAADNCAANNTLTVIYLGEAGISSPTLFETAFNNLFTPGQSYLLAVNTTGALTPQPYTITVQP